MKTKLVKYNERVYRLTEDNKLIDNYDLIEKTFNRDEIIHFEEVTLKDRIKYFLSRSFASFILFVAWYFPLIFILFLIALIVTSINVRF